MIGYFIGAIAALVFAGGAALKAKASRDKRTKLLSTEASTTGMLRELHAAATAAAGASAYSEVVEIEGDAQVGPGGLLTSEISKTECVWYRQKVTRRYKDVTRDSEGRRKVSEREEVVSDNTTREAFALQDNEGDVIVVPTTRVQGARKVVSEFRDQPDDNSNEISIGSFSFSFAGSSDGDTIGYEYEEWVLTPGTRLYVHGEAVDRAGRLEIRDPRGKEKLVISTRSEEEMLDHEKKELIQYAALAAGLVVLAIGLVVFALLR